MNDPKTKIVATLGPASAAKEVLREMMLSGMDVCRLNFSHGNYEFYVKLIACLLYTSPSPRDRTRSRMPSSA